jgi:endonuclease/exonuclease/phosphatase family metal-dependent hydrolase
MFAAILFAVVAVALLVCLFLKSMLFFFYTEYTILGDSSAVRSRQSSLRLFQYNVYWRPWWSHIGHPEFVRDRMLDTAEIIKSYDIVCIEEAWQSGSSVVADFVRICRKTGFQGVLTGPRPPFLSNRILGSGLLLLSKFPIVAHDWIEFDSGSRRDRLMGKGAIYGRIEVPACEHIHVIVTHLQASYMDDKDHGIDEEVRKRQLNQVAEFIRKNVSDCAPVFLCGDLNIDGRVDEEYRILKGLKIEGFEMHDTLFESLGVHPVTDGALENGKLVDTVLTIPDDFGIEMSLDYVFYLKRTAELGGESVVRSVTSEVAECKVARPYPQLSDHFGVSTTIDLVR